MHHPAAQAHAVLMVAADPCIITFATSVANVCEGGEAGAIEKPSAELVGKGHTAPSTKHGCSTSSVVFRQNATAVRVWKVCDRQHLLTLILLACLVVVRAQEDPCIALQERMIDTYNSPDCAYICSHGDVMAGTTPPDPVVCSDGDGVMVCPAWRM